MSADLPPHTPASIAAEARSTATPDRKRLLSVAEAAASLGISESLFRREVLTAWSIRTVHIGGRHLILPASLDAYVEFITPA